MRLAAQAKGGFYPTPPRVVDLIAELINTPPGYYNRGRNTLRILDPCCGAGEALAQLAQRLDRPNAIPIQTYGVELHRDRAQEAEERLDHALASDLFATSIANGAFGLLLLNPPYDYDSEDKRTEHAFLTHTTRYLADGGLLVFIVPRQRLAVSARYLSTHYGHMRCWAFPDPERQVFDQVALFAYRKADPVPDSHAERMALEWAVGEPEPLRSEHYTEYSPTTTPAGDILFTTRTVDPRGGSVRRPGRSGLWASTEITDTLWPARDTRTRPLMPLRRGHMAMLVSAGFLDNLVLEADGRRILVKGRTSKEMVHGGGLPREGGPPGEDQDHRGRPGPARRRDHRHRSIDGSPNRAASRGSVGSFDLRGLALSERLGRPLLSRKGRSKDADDHDPRSLLPVRATHRPRRASHADRLGGHRRLRQGRLLACEDIPPQRALLRRGKGRTSRPQGVPESSIDGSVRAASRRLPPTVRASHVQPQPGDVSRSLAHRKRPHRGAWRARLPASFSGPPRKRRTTHMNLGEFIDTFRDAIARRVVESYPPLYRPPHQVRGRLSENGRGLPRLLRKPLGAQEDAIRGAALSLEAHRGTTIVGEMGTGKTFIAVAAAHMAGFPRVLVLCPPHLTGKWKREVEMTAPGARAVIVRSITDLERLRIVHRLRPPSSR